MAIDKNKTPVLFSVGTNFAYKIAKKYYKNVHYVWCACEFNSKSQPPTSNPLTICKRYLEQIKAGDRHSKEIANNKSGVLKGAKIMEDRGVITTKQHKEIKNMVKYAEYEAFLPLIYVIPVDKISNSDIRCIEVPIKDRASDASVEYIIEDLKEDEFQIINFKNLLPDLMDIVDRRAGE